MPPTPLSVNSQLYANILTAVEINNCSALKNKVYPKGFSQYSGEQFSVHGSHNELDRLSTNVDRMSPNVLDRNNVYKTNPIYSTNLAQFKEKFFNDVIVESGNASDSEDEKIVSNSGDDELYATLSNHSLCSATTDANDDFEFYASETNLEKYNDKLTESKAELESNDGKLKEVKKEEEMAKPIVRVHKKKEPEKNCRVYVSMKLLLAVK